MANIVSVNVKLLANDSRSSLPDYGNCSAGLLDYRDLRHGKLHSSRAARMTEKIPVMPIANSVRTKRGVRWNGRGCRWTCPDFVDTKISLNDSVQAGGVHGR